MDTQPDTNQINQLALETILKPVGLELTDLQELITQPAYRSGRVDFSDLFFQTSQSEQWRVLDSIVRHDNYVVDGGAGVRSVSGECVGFTHTADIRMDQLRQALKLSSYAVRLSTPSLHSLSTPPDSPRCYGVVNPLESMSTEEKVAHLKRLDARARQADPRIYEVSVNIACSWSAVLIIDSNGEWSTDIRPLTRMGVRVIAKSDHRNEEGFCGGGRRQGLASVLENGVAESFVDAAVERALVNLESVSMKAGEMPVVMGPGWPGVLLHEAIGHGMEGDFNRKGLSVFSGSLNERVASSECTIVDDATLPNRRGSLSVDDEGVTGQRTVLVEDGVLKSYMQDRQNAMLSGQAPTGNGRRESWRYPPMPRMTNTFMLPGPHSPEEVIASVEDGLYVGNMSGGQVDITNGKFVFSTSEAYRIENGKKTYPVKDCTLIGDGHEVLARMSMVANDMELDEGLGVCGKDGQSVAVGVGQPTIRVDSMVVGGAA